MGDFYLTLPSSTESFNVKNTSSVYTTRLPQVLSLEKDKWVVAATDIIYPYSYKNVNKILKFYIHFKDGRQPLCFNIPANQYKTTEQVLAILNANSRKRRNAPVEGPTPEILQNAVDESIRKQLEAGLRQKDREKTLESIEKTFDKSLLAFLLTLVLLGSFEDVTSPVMKTTENQGQKDGDDKTGGEEENEKDNADGLGNDSDSEEGVVQTPPVIVVGNDQNEVDPNKTNENSLQYENENLQAAHQKAFNESINENLAKMFEMHKQEADERTNEIQNIMTQHSNFLNTFQRVDNSTQLTSFMKQLTDQQARLFEKLSENSENSLAKSIEESLKNQYNAKVEYVNLVKDVDETRLDQFSKLREAMQPRTIAFLTDLLEFTLENDLLRITFKSSDIECLEFDKECAYFLGFEHCLIRNDTLASSSIDFFGNISTLYVYCDIVDQSIVGNYKSSLLTVIPCKGKFGEMVQHTFPVPRYLPLMNSSVDAIKVSILSEFGEPVNFNWGSSIITLHFKKIK